MNLQVRMGRFYIDGQDTDSQSARSIVLDWIVIVVIIIYIYIYLVSYN